MLYRFHDGGQHERAQVFRHPDRADAHLDFECLGRDQRVHIRRGGIIAARSQHRASRARPMTKA